MSTQQNSTTTDAGLLILRILAGGFMIIGHGWGKLVNFSEKASSFGDPLGLGPEISMALATGAEFFGSLLVVVGLATRYASATVAFTMAVAAFIVHGSDGFGDMEMALVYGTIFLTLIVTGGGRFSVDHLIKSRSD
mgnify:CR=1 FL=1